MIKITWYGEGAYYDSLCLIEWYGEGAYYDSLFLIEWYGEGAVPPREYLF